MRRPLAGLDRPRRRRLLWVCGGVWLASGVAMLPLNDWLTDHGASIVDYEFARDDAARYLDGWGDGTWRATVSLILDYPFLFGYGGGSALILLLISDALQSGRWARTIGLAAWLPIAGAAFDAVENACLLVVLAGNTSTWPDLAAAAATVKFVLLGLALVALAVGLGALVARGLSRRSARSPAPAP